jgi:hypothetical protein
MRYLTVPEVIELYRQVMEASGGTVGILSIPALESSVAQPRATFNGKELYPTIIEKAASLGFSLIMNHPLWMATSGLVITQWKHFSLLMTMNSLPPRMSRNPSFFNLHLEISPVRLLQIG